MKNLLKQIELQEKEFKALDELIATYKTLKRTAVVDDEYTRKRHHYETDLKMFLKTCANNNKSTT